METLSASKCPESQKAPRGVVTKQRGDHTLLLPWHGDTAPQHPSLYSLNGLTDVMGSWCDAFCINSLYQEGGGRQF